MARVRFRQRANRRATCTRTLADNRCCSCRDKRSDPPACCICASGIARRIDRAGRFRGSSCRATHWRSGTGRLARAGTDRRTGTAPFARNPGVVVRTQAAAGRSNQEAAAHPLADRTGAGNPEEAGRTAAVDRKIADRKLAAVRRALVAVGAVHRRVVARTAAAARSDHKVSVHRTHPERAARLLRSSCRRASPAKEPGWKSRRRDDPDA